MSSANHESPEFHRDGRHATAFQFSIQTFLVIIAMVAAVSAVLSKVRDPTSPAQKEVAAILLSSATIDEQVERLAPYVKLGDHIADVKQRLTRDAGSRRSFDTDYEVTFFFDGIDLELHHTKLGEVIGIRKLSHQLGVAPVWMAARDPWPGPKPPQNTGL